MLLGKQGRCYIEAQGAWEGLKGPDMSKGTGDFKNQVILSRTRGFWSYGKALIDWGTFLLTLWGLGD